LMPWTLTLAVLAVILGGIRMIWEQRGAPLKDLLRSLLTLTLVSGLGLGVISILVIAADAFSVAIIERSTDGKGFAESMSIFLTPLQTDVGVFILIVLGLIGLIASLVQIVLMVVRSGMLVILAGILPTTAAFTNTEMGRQWFQKAVGWTIAFILYKPAAAIVYSVAFLLMGNTSGQDGLVGSITGFTLMIVALFALPALMRFVTPMVGAVASGSGAAAGAAVGAMATGAVSLGRGGSGRGNAAPIPATTSTTASTQSISAGASPKGCDGASGPRGGGGRPTPGVTGPGGAAGATAAGKAGSAGAGASGGAAAAGPAGMALAAGAQVATKTSQAIEKTAQDSTGEGPSGSN
jgi:type IV secretion system protein TrbL